MQPQHPVSWTDKVSAQVLRHCHCRSGELVKVRKGEHAGTQFFSVAEGAQFQGLMAETLWKSSLCVL